MLHVVESLGRGAVENWLLRTLEHGVRRGTPVDWTFYTTLADQGAQDERSRSLGAPVVHTSRELHDTLGFMRDLRRHVRQARYDVLHCHHDFVNAVYLVATAGLPVPYRVAHVHNADVLLPVRRGIRARLLREPLRATTIALSDSVIGISDHTLDTFLAGRRRRPADGVLYYGVDTSHFRRPPPDRGATVAELGLPANARLLLYAGRMVDYKNPLFVLAILQELAAAEPSVYAVFAGAGPLENAVRERARAMGLEERVRVLGWRPDVTDLMRISDVFVFPRLETAVDGIGIEGLGLVVVEAQAAGVPLVISHGIPDDAIVARAMTSRLRLSDGPARWAAEVRGRLSAGRPDPDMGLRQVEQSRFALDRSFESLRLLHEHGAERR